MLDSRFTAYTPKRGIYIWRKKPIYYRPGTSDTEVIYKILLRSGKKAEYYIPSTIVPNTILDIGGNIGIASIYFANLFPDAQIFTFEPVPNNIAILSDNIAPYPNIRAFPIALGNNDGHFEMFSSHSPRNFGGFSFFEHGSDKSKTVEIQMRNVKTVLTEIGLKQVDIIKIDTEGSEYNILTALDESVLRSVKWIIGEMHGERDFQLLAYLSQWFDIGLKKRLTNRLFMFRACNKELTSSVR